MIKKFIISIFFVTIAFAIQKNSMDIDAQIQKIRTAPPQLRVKLMNEFKRRISQMNQSERLDAIESMQKKVGQKSSQNIQEKVMHINQRKELIEYQNINNKHAGNPELQIQRSNHKEHQNFTDAQY